MKILWVTPALWNKTGYATQSKRIIPYLQKMGHEVVVLATSGLGGGVVYDPELGVKHLPLGNKMAAIDIIPYHVEAEQADLVVTVQDNWIFPPQVYGKFPWVAWFPVDDDPVSPELVESLVDEKTGSPHTLRALTYSKWGVQQLAKVGIKAEYLPETVDTSVYKPLDKAESKKWLGYKEDDFVVGMVAANMGYPCRKAFDKNLEGFALFAQNHPNAKLYLHTNFDSSWRAEKAPSLIELKDLLAQQYPVLLEKGRISFPDQYQLFMGVPDDKMPKVYSAMDVLLGATMAEGFGLPLLEAQSCGVPIIVTDFSSMPEMVGAGWKVRYTDRFLTGRMSYQVWPDPQDIAAKLEEAYQADRKALGEEARKFALDFDNSKAALEYWKPLLDSLK